MIGGFTGTSLGMTLQQCLELRDLFEDWSIHELHVGDCVGADHQAYSIARHLGMRVVGHPPTNPIKRTFLKYDTEFSPYPYLERNHNIVDCVKRGSGMLFVAPSSDHETLRSGTWATKRYAEKVGCSICILSRG